MLNEFRWRNFTKNVLVHVSHNNMYSTSVIDYDYPLSYNFTIAHPRYNTIKYIQSNKVSFSKKHKAW